MPTELGRSQVEVQWCPLSSEGPRLRSSGAHCAWNLAVEVQQCQLRAEVGRRDWRQVGKAEVDVELDADMVEEKPEEEEEEEAEEEEDEENSSDKIQQPSPGRWGKMSTWLSNCMATWLSMANQL